MKINWQEESTKRGAVILLLVIPGLIGWFMGKDVTGLITLAMAISGYMKLTRPD
jgi:hypothetical protein